MADDSGEKIVSPVKERCVMMIDDRDRQRLRVPCKELKKMSEKNGKRGRLIRTMCVLCDKYVFFNQEEEGDIQFDLLLRNSEEGC